MLSADYFSVPGEEIKDITAVLTLVGGEVVHADGDFASLAPPLPPASPDWAPVRVYGGYHQAAAHGRATQTAHACAVHGHGFAHASRHRSANRTPAVSGARWAAHASLSD